MIIGYARVSAEGKRSTPNKAHCGSGGGEVFAEK